MLKQKSMIKLDLTRKIVSVGPNNIKKGLLGPTEVNGVKHPYGVHKAFGKIRRRRNNDTEKVSTGRKEAQQPTQH